MRHHRIAALLVLFALTAAVAAKAATDQPSEGVPVLSTVNPDAAKAGALVTARGEFLDKSHLAELFLSTDKTDVKVEIVEQAATLVKFKIPADAAPGRYGLTVLMAGREPTLLEQPVSLAVKP